MRNIAIFKKNETFYHLIEIHLIYKLLENIDLHLIDQSSTLCKNQTSPTSAFEKFFGRLSISF